MIHTYNADRFLDGVDVLNLALEFKEAEIDVDSITLSDNGQECYIISDATREIIDTIVLIHKGPDSLEHYKNIKYKNIDERTDELISRGFNYAGKMFSLSLPAQIRLLGINQVRNDPNLTYPIRWNTIHDNDYYEIANPEDFHLFYMKSLATYRAHVDVGTALKDQVREATSKAEIDAIIDNR